MLARYRQKKWQHYAKEKLVMPLSKPVITTGPVMSRLCLLCFPFIFSSPSLFIQLSGSGPKRSKREAVGDHSAQPLTETQKSITLVSPRKETYLLVSGVGSALSPHSVHSESHARDGRQRLPIPWESGTAVAECYEEPFLRANGMYYSGSAADWDAAVPRAQRLE